MSRRSISKLWEYIKKSWLSQRIWRNMSGKVGLSYLTSVIFNNFIYRWRIQALLMY
jgi:hypothetical protein